MHDTKHIRKHGTINKDISTSLNRDETDYQQLHPPDKANINYHMIQHENETQGEKIHLYYYY